MGKILISICIAIICLEGCATNNGRKKTFTEHDIQTVSIDKAQNISVAANSCTAPIIDLNDAVSDGTINAYELIDTMFFVPLQTKEESIFFNPYRVYLDNDRIYIEDKKFNILIFDDKGNFIKSLTKGEGPGEINRVVGIAIDKQKLVVLQASDRLFSYYDKDGNFIEKGARCPLNTSEFFITDWGYILFQSTFEKYHLGDNAKYALLLANDNLNVVYKGINVVKGYDHVYCGNLIFSTGNTCYVSQFFNDTIYEVSKKNLSDIKIKYILDYSEKKAVDNNNLEMSDKFYNGSCVMENSGTQLFKFWSPRRGLCHVIRDKHTGKAIGGTHVNFNLNILPEYFGNLLTVHNDYFVSYIPSYKGMHYDSPAVSNADNQKIAGRDEEDNGILAFFKFKEIK